MYENQSTPNFMNAQYGQAIGNAILSEKPAREPLAIEVMRSCEAITIRAHQIAERVNVKLRPVMTSEPPRAEAECSKELQREFPPMFSELKNYFENINCALASIESAMDRTEL